MVVWGDGCGSWLCGVLILVGGCLVMLFVGCLCCGGCCRLGWLCWCWLW